MMCETIYNPSFSSVNSVLSTVVIVWSTTEYVLKVSSPSEVTDDNVFTVTDCEYV